MLALVSMQTAGAQKPHATTEAEFRDAVNRVEQLTRSLREDIALYQEHLQRAMKIYGRGFSDPGYPQRLPGFDQDIRTGDIAQTEKIKRGVFASILITSGVHLDPDPLHDWAEVEKSLDRYPPLLDKASSLNAGSNILDASSHDNMSAETVQRLKSRWQAAARQAEQERTTVASLRPTKLGRGQTFANRAAEGMNLHFTLLGIEFGRDMGNVNALIQLTYSGHSDASHFFLLTVLDAAEQKTRTDTWVSSKTLLIYSNAADPARYGHLITAQDHGGYRVTGARIADVAPKVHDWIWKSVAAPGAAGATAQDLEKAVQAVQGSRREMDTAIGAFQQLSLTAVRENDDALASTSANPRKVKLPDQDLKFWYPDVRARLHAIRALSAGDPRFLAAMDAVNAARLHAETSINEGSELFGYFNAIATHTAPQLPWKNIQKLAVEFMDASDEVRRAGAGGDSGLPQALATEEAGVTSQLSFIVEQINRGQGPAGQKTFLMSERILRGVHWAVKGIPRHEYSAQLIEISPGTGLHRVQSALPPAYIQGPGGIRQVFRDLAETRAATF